MATTQLFVELLVIGSGAVLWLWLIAAGFMGTCLSATASDSQVLLVGVLIAVAYLMGILVDRVSRSIFRLPERHYEQTLLLEKRLPPQRDTQRYVFLHGSSLAPQIEYNRSRLRICRAWCLNFLIGTIALAVMRGVHGNVGSALPPECALTHVLGVPHPGLIAAGALLTVVTGTVAVLLIRDHYTNLAESYLFLRAPRATEREGAPETTGQ